MVEWKIAFLSITVVLAALANESSTSSVRMQSAMDQPTTFFEKRSNREVA